MGDRKGVRPGVEKGTTIKTSAAKARITGASKPELTEKQKEEIKKKEVTNSILGLIRYKKELKSETVYYLKSEVDFNKVVIELCKLDFLSVEERNNFINNFTFNETSIRDFKNAKDNYTTKVFPLIRHALFVANYVIDGYNKKIDILNKLNIPGVGKQLSKIVVAEGLDKNYESTDVVLNLDDISKNEYGKVIIPNSVSNGINTKINLKKVSPQKTDSNGSDLFQEIGKKINSNLKKFIVENLLNYNKDNKESYSIDDCSYNYAIQDIKNLLKAGVGPRSFKERGVAKDVIDFQNKMIELTKIYNNCIKKVEENYTKLQEKLKLEKSKNKDQYIHLIEEEIKSNKNSCIELEKERILKQLEEEINKISDCNNFEEVNKSIDEIKKRLGEIIKKINTGASMSEDTRTKTIQQDAEHFAKKFNEIADICDSYNFKLKFDENTNTFSKENKKVLAAPAPAKPSVIKSQEKLKKILEQYEERALDLHNNSFQLHKYKELTEELEKDIEFIKLEERVEELEGQQRKLSNNLKSNLKEQNGIKESIKKIEGKNTDESKKELEDLKNKLDKLSTEYNDISSRIQKNQTEQLEVNRQHANLLEQHGESINKLNEDVNSLKNQVKELSKAKNKAEEEKKKLNDEIEKINNQILSLTGEEDDKGKIPELERQLKGLQTNLDTTNANIENLENQIKEKNNNLEERIATLEKSSTEYSKQLKNHGDRLNELENKIRTQLETNKEEQNKIKGDIEDLIKQLGTDEGNEGLKGRITELEETQKTLEKAQVNLAEQLGKISFQISENQRIQSEVNDQINARLDELQEEIKGLQEQVGKLSEEKEKAEEERTKILGDIETIKSQILGLKGKDGDISKLKKKLEGELEGLKASLGKTDTRIGNLEKQIKDKNDELENRIKKLEDSVSNHGDRLTALESNINKQLQTNKVEQDKIKEDINKTNQEINKLKKNEEENKEQIEGLENRIKALEQAKQTLESEQSKLAEQLGEISSKIQKNQTEQLKVNRQHEDLLKQQGESINKLNEDVNSLKNQVDELSKAKEEAEEEKKKLNDKINEINNKILSLTGGEDDKGNIPELKKELEELQGQLDTINTNIENLENQIKEKNNNLEKRIAVLETSSKKYSEQLEDHENRLNELENNIKTQLDTNQKEQNRIKENIEELKKQLGTNEGNEGLKGRITALEQAKQTLESKQDELTEQLSDISSKIQQNQE